MTQKLVWWYKEVRQPFLWFCTELSEDYFVSHSSPHGLGDRNQFRQFLYSGKLILWCYTVYDDQTNFGTVKHNCWLLGHRVSRNTREIRSLTHVWRMRIYNAAAGLVHVTSACVSHCRTINGLIVVYLCKYFPRSRAFSLIVRQLSSSASIEQFRMVMKCTNPWPGLPGGRVK